MAQKEVSEDNYSFPQKVWITGGIIAFIVVMLLLFKITFSVLLLVLAGSLIAVFFHGLSSFIEQKTKWNGSLSLVVSVVGILLFIIALFWLIGEKVQSQVTELTDKLPATIQNAKDKLNKSDLGKKLVQYLSSPKTQEKAKSVGSSFFKTTFGALGDVYIILFLGIFFTVSPQLYKKGIVQLVPKQGRKKATDVLDILSSKLKKWLKGQIFAMLVVFVLTAIGLLIIGTPMWLALALIAGVLNFIPNFGPLIAMIPAVLVGLTQSLTTAAMIAGLYILVQVIESNFITPYVQQKLVNVPPALIIIAQLLMGVLTGGWGIILATPLMVILMIMVQELYIKNINKNN